MRLLTLFLSCNLKILHDCYFISFDNGTFEKLLSPPSHSFFFPVVRSDACIVKGFAVSALVQI